MRTPLRSLFTSGVLGWVLLACAGEEPAAELGPVDGHDLPATEIHRVAAGTVAPDFSLRTLAGDTLTLSDFRGEKNVVLVFYRGHW